MIHQADGARLPRNEPEAIRDWMDSGAVANAEGMSDAVIFDCDGVLVDSEIVHLRVEAEILAGIGLTYEPAAYRKHAKALAEVEPLIERFRA